VKTPGEPVLSRLIVKPPASVELLTVTACEFCVVWSKSNSLRRISLGAR
jgi:hypothetical protein